MKTDLRKEARGRDCQVKIFGVCNNNRDTTVLAHINEKSLVGAGMGMKVPDEFGAHCCSACHDELDRRTNISDLSVDEKLIAHYQGMIKTMHLLMKEGKLWKQ